VLQQDQMDHVADQSDHANEQAEHPEREQHAANALGAEDAPRQRYELLANLGEQAGQKQHDADAFARPVDLLLPILVDPPFAPNSSRTSCRSSSATPHPIMTTLTPAMICFASVWVGRA